MKSNERKNTNSDREKKGKKPRKRRMAKSEWDEQRGGGLNL